MGIVNQLVTGGCHIGWTKFNYTRVETGVVFFFRELQPEIDWTGMKNNKHMENMEIWNGVTTWNYWKWIERRWGFGHKTTIWSNLKNWNVINGRLLVLKLGQRCRGGWTTTSSLREPKKKSNFRWRLKPKFLGNLDLPLYPEKMQHLSR